MKKLKLLLALFALLVGTNVSWAQKDVTSQYITNATLSNGLTGWTVSHFNAPVKGNNTVGFASEAYSGWNGFDPNTTPYYLKQTITLPAGHYTLVNYSFYREGESYNTDSETSRAKLYAGANEKDILTLGSLDPAPLGYANSQAEGANCFDSKMYRNTVDFIIDEDNTSIEIGLTGTFSIMRSWCIAGMFELINNDIPATMDAPFDVTGYITNPGFEYRNMTGWTVSPSGFFGTQNNNQGFKVGGYYAEKWQQSGALPAGSMSQTLTDLPAGFYKLTANLGGNGTYIDLNGKTASWEADKDYTVGYVLAENEDLTITAGKTAEGTANWIHFDNFRLQFCGDVAAALTTLCAEVTNYESKLSNSDYATLLSAVNGYNKSYSDVDELLAAIDAIQALYNSADLYIEYTNALAAAQAVDQNAPMNADVLSALQSAIGTAVTMASSAADKVSATNSLNTATVNANISIGNYVEAKTILDAANSYDEDGQASYVADETIVAIHAAFDDRTLTSVTNEQKTAAQAALATACKAQTQIADNSDMTVCIVNPGIDGNVDGWTCEKKGTTGGTGGPLKPSKDAIEYWAGSTINEDDDAKGFDYYQTITDLPIGVYTIGAEMLNSTNGETGASWNGGGTSGVYGKTARDEVQSLITIDDETFRPYTTDEILVVDGELKVGVKNVASLTGRWFAADNFKLTYVRQLNAEELEDIAKEKAVAAYNEALAAAQTIATGIAGSIPSTAYSNLQSTITSNTLTDGTSSEYNVAAAALNEAATSVQSLVDPYALWLKFKNSAAAIALVPNNNDEATTTFTGALSTQNAAAEAALTAADLNTATITLKTAVRTFIKDAEPTAGNKFEITCLIENPSFDNNTIDGWTREVSSGGNAQTNYTCNEFWNNTFDFYQDLPDLPNGSYQLSVQAFSRPGGNDTAYPAYVGGTNSVTAELYVNNDASTVGNIYAYTGNTSGAKVSGDDFPDYKCEVDGGTDYWVPNGMEGAHLYFADENVYKTTVAALVENGNLRIGFRDESYTNSQWTIFDNFRLYYYGSDKAVYYAQYLPQLIAEVEADKSNALYINVTGKELSELNTALAVDASGFTTEKQYSDAINAIKDAQTAYRAAYPSYDALVAAKEYATLTEITANIGTGVFQYPASTPSKWIAYSDAKTAVDDYTVSATSTAADIQTLVDALDAAIADYNGIILNAPDADKRYWLTVVDGDNTWSGNAVTFVAGARTVETPGGEMGGYGIKYLALANANLNQALKFTTTTGNKYKVSAINAADGNERYICVGSVYDGEDNDLICTTEDVANALEIEILATSTNGQFQLCNTASSKMISNNGNNDMYTANSCNFTIVEASQATVNIKIPAEVQYATRIFPFAPELPEGVTAYTCDATNEILELTEVVTPEANVPYILVAEEGCASTDLKGWGVLSSLDPKAGGDDNHLTGVYTAQKAPKDSYVLQNQNDKVAFYLVAENDEPTVGAYRCYLTAPSNVESRAAFYFDKNETTAIRAIEALTSGDAEIFNAAGARVPVLQKGVNIVKRNDKSYKVIVK